MLGLIFNAVMYGVRVRVPVRVRVRVRVRVHVRVHVHVVGSQEKDRCIPQTYIEYGRVLKIGGTNSRTNM